MVRQPGTSYIDELGTSGGLIKTSGLATSFRGRKRQELSSQDYGALDRVFETEIELEGDFLAVAKLTKPSE